MAVSRRKKQPKAAWAPPPKRTGWEINRDGLVFYGDLLREVHVHHYIGYPPDVWFVSCSAIGLERHELPTRGSSQETAMEEALEAIHDLTSNWQAEVNRALCDLHLSHIGAAKVVAPVVFSTPEPIEKTYEAFGYTKKDIKRVERLVDSVSRPKPKKSSRRSK